MNLNYFSRRWFMKGSLAAAATMAVVPLAGCPSAATLAEWAQVLGNNAANVVSAIGNSALAQAINTAATAAVNAITNWKKGTPAQDVIEALGILMDNLNLIPIASPYIALIDIAISVVQSILAMFPAPAPVAMLSANATVVAKVHKSRVVNLGSKTPTSLAETRKLWNATVKANNFPATLMSK